MYSTKRMKVLIVDDEIAFTEFIEKVISRAFENIDLVVLNSGKEAISVAQKDDIDLILLDCNMPDISGINVAKLLQHTKRTENIPIVFVTNMNYEDFKKEGFELGSVDYISKPVDVNLLINRLSLYKTIIEQNILLEIANSKLKKKLHKQKSKNEVQEHIILHNSKTSVMGEMIGALAHQWRQPLNIIATSMINMETKAELGTLNLNDIQRINTKINSTLHLLSKTIDDFRNFFLNSHSQQSINLVDVINSTISIVKTQFESHNIQINLFYDQSDNYEFMGYYNEMRQVFLNLLTNSKDAIEINKKNINENTGVINITLQKKENYILVKFCDNGGGADEKICKKIFNPYFSTKFAEQGTGIGLFMVKNIIEKLHKGTIQAYNFNDGFCFEVKLFNS